MFFNFFIGLREGFEVALVVGIIVVYFVCSGWRDRLVVVWVGVAVVVIVSLGVGVVFIFMSRLLLFMV